MEKEYKHTCFKIANKAPARDVQSKNVIRPGKFLTNMICSHQMELWDFCMKTKPCENDSNCPRLQRCIGSYPDKSTGKILKICKPYIFLHYVTPFKRWSFY